MTPTSSTAREHLQRVVNAYLACTDEPGFTRVASLNEIREGGESEHSAVRRDAVASALKRFKAAGTVRQLARGLYDYPVHDPVLGGITPSADAIARALVVRDVIRLQPSGAYAANVLGLSDQVPSRIIFLTDGPARKVQIGKREILLQHTTPRNMATAGRKSGTIIQALRYIGKSQVNDAVLATVRRFIGDQDHAAIRKDLRYAPAWIADLVRPLTDPVM